MKWKPSKKQRAAFAQRMQDPEQRAAYTARKQARAVKRRQESAYNYDSAGGWYIPTRTQYEAAISKRIPRTPEQQEAANHVIYGYNHQQPVPHDMIHIINCLIRANPDF